MERRYELSYDSLSEGTELKRSRKRFWTDWKKEIYDHSLARAMYKWKQFGLADTRCQKDFLLALDYLRSGDSRKFYLSQDVIQNHPTRVVNGVNYLYYLGITDLRSQLRDAFTEAYAGKIDSLSEMEFQDMIYGLTHFIIGGSNYYQQFCSSDEYFWILNIFRKYIGKITTSCTPDAIAEVGLCFRLCQVSRESIPHEISWALSAAFAKGKGYIPRNSHDLDSLEHRNVIAYLYFCNFNNLYPGPNLGREEKYRDLLEAQCGLMERRGEDVAIPSANVLFPVWRAPFNRTTGASASAACNSSSIFRLYMVEYLPSYGELSTIIHIGQSENPENGKSPEPDTHRSPLPLFGKLAVLRFSPA